MSEIVHCRNHKERSMTSNAWLDRALKRRARFAA
jgi:hypothetical protein